MIAIALLIAWAITPAAPPLDDAYIVLHSSEVLARGGDAAYGVPALTGITSPAYLVFVFAAQMVLPGLGAIRIATAAGVALYIAGVWALAATLGARGTSRVLVLLAALTPAPLAINIVNGLETGWACAIVVWGLVGLRRDQPLLVGLTAGLLPALRPDLTPIAVVLLALNALRGSREQRDRPSVVIAAPAAQSRSQDAHDDGDGLKDGLREQRALRDHRGAHRWASVVLAVCIVAAFGASVRAGTGNWWPSTMDAKRLFFAEGCQPIEVKARTALTHLLAWAAISAPVAAGALLALRDRTGAALVAGAAIVISVYAWTLPGALYHNEYRYVVPILAPIGIYGFAGLAASGVRYSTVASAILIALSTVAAPRYIAGRRSDAEELKRITAWAEGHFNAGTRVLVHDAGAISRVNGVRAIDLVGLKTISSIDEHRRWTWPSCGVERGRAVDSIARRAMPEYFVVLNRWDEIFHFTSDLEKNGWRLDLVRPPDELERSYAVYRLAPGAADANRRRQETSGQHE